MTEQYPNIPWRRIIGTGNQIPQGYFRVDPKVMWGVVTNHLPRLKLVINTMTKAADKSCVSFC
ncbi:MAG: HepT-like ribonuclease domain-containing protein [Hyphomicrobiaceae bacterium]